MLAALLRWRAGTAQAAGIGEAVVVADRTLAAIATRRPTGVAELADVPGLGPVKAARYGADLVAIVAGTG
ncbi:hypothetical protein BH20ACT2_BH20ACT2_08010 [soil metagenome]